MDYLKLVDQLAIRTWLDKDSVKRFFETLADILTQLEDGEWVKTPMGTFRAYVRSRKRIKIPNGKWIVANPQLQVRFRPGKLLKVDFPLDHIPREKKRRKKKTSAQ